VRFALVFAAALALAGPAYAQPAGLDAVFARFKPDTPGCALGIKRATDAPVFRSYGSADLEHAIPITPDTVFEAGSVSKQFTAASILLLVQDGRLKLSDDIRKYVPEMPDYGRPITIDMLLSHTSGLRDWGEVMELAGWPRTTRIYTPAEVLQIAARQRALNYPPGEAYSYTNTGYNLAALIVQRVSGRTLADFTAERLFRPLAMTHTGWRDNFRRVVPGRAVAYDPSSAGGFAQDMPFENTYGHGGLLTTVGDLLIWNDVLTSGRLGRTATARLQQQAVLTGGRRIAYARGLVVLSWRGHSEVSHSGSTAGYRAWLARYPADQLSVALLCNTSEANPVQIGHKVADLYLGAPTAEPPAPPTDAQDLARLPGVYVDERTGAVLRVIARDGTLRTIGGGTFVPGTGSGRYTGGGSDFTFADGGVQRRTLDGEVVSYRRVTPVQPTPAELEAVAGGYASPEAGAVLIVGLKGGALVLTGSDRPGAPMVAAPLYRDAFTVQGSLMRLVRGADGKVTGLRFTGSRVYSLEFRRISAP